MTPKAILLYAAGFGTRMRPLTDTRPKPLIEVAGQTLLDHALDVAAGVGPLRTVVNTHYLFDQIEGHLSGRDVAISHEAPDILETGGGLKQALPLLAANPVFTLNTDAIWQGPNALEMLARHWDPDVMDALLLAVPLARALGRVAPGDLSVGSDGQVIWGGDLVFTGAQIIKTDRIAAHPDLVFSVHPIWNAMQASGKLHACLYPGHWCDVGRPDNIALAEGMLRDV